jgi:hypothetical protein
MCCPALRRETTEWGDWRSTPVRGTSLAAERADTPHSHPVCTCAAQATCVGARAHATGRGWMHGECAARDGTHHASATHRHTHTHTHTHTRVRACVLLVVRRRRGCARIASAAGSPAHWPSPQERDQRGDADPRPFTSEGEPYRGSRWPRCPTCEQQVCTAVPLRRSRLLLRGVAPGTRHLLPAPRTLRESVRVLRRVWARDFRSGPVRTHEVCVCVQAAPQWSSRSCARWRMRLRGLCDGEGRVQRVCLGCPLEARRPPQRWVGCASVRAKVRGCAHYVCAYVSALEGATALVLVCAVMRTRVCVCAPNACRRACSRTVYCRGTRGGACRPACAERVGDCPRRPMGRERRRRGAPVVCASGAVSGAAPSANASACGCVCA